MTDATAPEDMVPAIVRRFPALASLPRAGLGQYPTPVQRAEALAPGLWVKRDDLAGNPLGGNKARSLDFLLGGVGRGDRIVTVGATGSTHALATALYGSRLGATVTLYRWPQESSEVARRTAELTAKLARVRDVGSVPMAYARAFTDRLRGARWIAAGGSVPLGALGHASAALELSEQIGRGEMPMPDRIVVALGSGGTTAGLLAGAMIAGLGVEIIAARVVPRVVASHRKVMRLTRATLMLLRRLSGEEVPFSRGGGDAPRLRIVHDVYGGAYGRETPAGRAADERYCAWSGGSRLDATYSAKACAVALAARGGTTLFWLTFDGRWLERTGHTLDTPGSWSLTSDTG